MRVLRSKILLLTVVPIVIISCTILLISNYYPLSSLSINKEYVYTPDTVLAGQYETKLNKLKDNYKKNDTNDLTTIRMQQGLLNVYKQDFLISGDSVTINDEKLRSIKSDVIETRNTLLDLTFSEEYDENTKNYLQLLLESFIKLEIYIQNAELTDTYTQRELENIFNKLQMHFYSSLKYFNSFYNSYTNQ